MTRRLAQHRPRRLLRMRPTVERSGHGLDLALAGLRLERRAEPEAAQRADQRALRALADENALLARELGRVQTRCTQWRDDCIAQAERLEAQLMRARADSIVKETQLAALRDTLAALHENAAAGLAHPQLVRRRNHALEGALGACRVLCVGGRARQMPIYRDLVERRGGLFMHVDALDADCLPALRRALDGADFVILQPGYVCQGACQAVEAHCARLGVRCVQLDKPCVIGFARSLDRAVDAT